MSDTVMDDAGGKPATVSPLSPAPIDQVEMEELLASIETPSPPSPLSTSSPIESQRQASPPYPADQTLEETDQRKLTPVSSRRTTPRPLSNRPASSGDSTPSQLSLFTPTSEITQSAPEDCLLSLSGDLPQDLDALTEFLRTGAQTPHTHRDDESHGDRASLTEAADKVPVLPPLHSPSNTSLSFVPIVQPGQRRSAMLQKQASLTLLGPASRASEVDPIVGSQNSPRHSPRGQLKTQSPSRRRLTIGTHEISPHALERLGVNTNILRKEKGMKKLGISDVDIERSEEIRRYSGVPLNTLPVTKVEFMFGFTKEQLLRVKAINRLGTSEEEVQDDYSRRVSRLGMHDTSIMQN